VVARPERAQGYALARDRGLPGVDEEEGGPPGALPDDRLALLEAPLLEQTGHLLGLPPVQVGEELDALDGGHGVARRRAGRRGAGGRPRGDGAALEQVEPAVLDGPLDVAARAVDLLARQRQRAERRELRVVEAELAHLRRRYRLLEGAPVRQRADGDALAPGLALQHLAGAIEPELVRNDEAGDHRLAEAPARLDESLVDSVTRTSPLAMRPNSAGPETRRAGPS
jgi:hypothetical protein